MPAIGISHWHLADVGERVGSAYRDCHWLCCDRQA
jgi:hypothetical protein